MSKEDDRENTKRQREYDEAQTQVINEFPRMWKGIYDNSVLEGFTKHQAMELLKIWILSSAIHGVHFHPPVEPPSPPLGQE